MSNIFSVSNGYAGKAKVDALSAVNVENDHMEEDVSYPDSTT